ncbi:thioredoxin family protein [Lederbergia lenta]|uniref:thioredoxin family protein n=1 Tax=Lederbergia lenta TaxID=1467 RepID=UPI00203D3EE2|nr:thioredoxin family protein [Lederbergia lenta]MCM3109865.1 thioredoxin family protein [Lederbergia lenta]
MKILKFYLPTCTPCKFVDSFLQEQQVEYESINVEENKKLSDKYEIMSVPVTILIGDDGDEIYRSNGFKPAELSHISTQFRS